MHDERTIHFDPESLDPLPRQFYDGPTLKVAQALLGCYLCHRSNADGRLMVGQVVETEAYLGARDRACHASARGRKGRAAIMFGPPGHAYVYQTYGIHLCLNVVTETVGVAGAVLIRALEPLLGITERTCGPALLTRALGVQRDHTGLDMTSGPLFFTQGQVTPPRFVTTARIGVDYAEDWASRPFRFCLYMNRHVSKKPWKIPRSRSRHT